MRRIDWLLVLGLVPVAWALDQATKAWALQTLIQPYFYGPFGFVLHENAGAIFGTFADLPPLLRIVSLSTGGVFLAFIYGAIQHLLPSRSLPFRIGLSLLLGGILGNVTDRIIHGHIFDFLVLKLPFGISPAYNLADMIQWIGYSTVIYGLIRDGSLFWPSDTIRKRKWVKPQFQLKYCLTLIAIGAGFSAINGVFVYTFLKVTIDDLSPVSTLVMEDRFLNPFLQIYAVMSVAFLFSLFILGRILSHRTAGPIYAFDQYLQDLIQGNDRAFRVRQGDEFKELESLAEALRPIILAHSAQKKNVLKDVEERSR